MCIIDVCTMCIIHQICSREISESVFWKFLFFSPKNLKIKNGHSAKSTRKFKISVADSTETYPPNYNSPIVTNRNYWGTFATS